MSRPILWNSRTWRSNVLWPVSLLWRAVTWIRRSLYQRGLWKPYQARVPVVVVGNIVMGGAGKTPLTMALVDLLKESGWNPGVVSRGYRSDQMKSAQLVNKSSLPEAVGDEPLLIAQRTHVPVAVFPKRAAAIDLLLRQHDDIDILICDDGLQHYGLARDVEIAVVHATELHGNGFCFPAGPLREPVSRLATVDFVVINGSTSDRYAYTTTLNELERLSDGYRMRLADFNGTRAHVIAGIAHPDVFFSTLACAGIQIDGHVFADHHRFSVPDLEFGDDLPILMTEKDAVKCSLLDIDLSNCWQTILKVDLSEKFNADFHDRVNSLR